VITAGRDPRGDPGPPVFNKKQQKRGTKHHEKQELDQGTGVCRNVGGQSVACVARWVFTDGGERGGCIRDTAIIEVVDANTNATLIEVSDGDVDCGNHQAHSQ
jgi:hypothetical protein